MFNHPNIIKYLVSKDADMELMDTDQRTPILLAATRECWQSVRTLRDLGANWLVKVRIRYICMKKCRFWSCGLGLASESGQTNGFKIGIQSFPA